MFWKPDWLDQRVAKRAGVRRHAELFPSSPLWGSTPKHKRSKVRAENRWNGPYVYPKPKPTWGDLFKEFDNYRDKLRKRGFEELGSGAFSSVFGKPGCSKVIKVCHDGDRDPWPLFAAWAHANPSPFVPVIYAFKRYKGFYVAVIERLKETVGRKEHTAGHRTAINMFRDFLSGESDTNPVEKAMQDAVFALYPGVETVLQGMSDELDGEGYWDLHGENWMVREGGQLVITDPISAKQGSSQRSSKVQRIKGSERLIAA